MLKRFSITQRFVLLVAIGGALSLLIAVALWTQQPNFQVLFTKLSPEDANSLIEKLNEFNVPYEMASGGTSILVPRSQVHTLRLKLAGEGLPAGGGVGFEIFDRSTIGMSDFVQKMNYQRALQGELARTIAQMAEVQRARVHLAIPQRRLFRTEQERPRASVVVSLKGQQSLGKSQVQGIVHLVASSVEGLAPKDVTVVDGHGHLLSAVADDQAGMLTGSQLEHQQSFERNMENRIQTMLERIVGMNKAVVRVFGVFDFRTVEHTEETYDPESQVVRSEQRSQERASEVNGLIGGVPGVASNVPPGEAAESGQGSSNTSRVKSESVNYEISKRVSRIVEPTGTIKKLSLAVLVDGRYEAAEGAGEAGDVAARQYVPRTEEEMTRIEEVVKKAMGFSAERGDEVEVVNVQFGFAPETELGASAEEQGISTEIWAPVARYAVGGVLFLVILMFVARPLLSMLATSQEALEGASGDNPNLPAPLKLVEAQLSEGARAQVLEQARNDPQSTASVVKQWLKGTT